MFPSMALERILYIPDLHAPYHDKQAWRLVLKVARTFKPHTIITMGDFGDFYSVSRHAKSPHRDRKLRWELDSVNACLDQLDALQATRKIFIGGNHESRLTRYLQEKAPELFDVVTIPELLHLPTRHWEYVPYGKHIRLGKVFHTHDVGAAGRYACHRALDYYKHGVVTGHVHRMGYVVEGNLGGDTQISANFGWLGDRRQIDYAQEGKVERDSALGFGIGYHDPATHFVYLTPIPIVKNSCVVEGQLYRC